MKLKGKSSKNYNFYYYTFFLTEGHTQVHVLQRFSGGGLGAGDQARAAEEGAQAGACGTHKSVSSYLCTVTPKLLSQRAFLTVRHTSFVSGLQRPSAAEGLETKLGLQREGCRGSACGAN